MNHFGTILLKTLGKLKGRLKSIQFWYAKKLRLGTMGRGQNWGISEADNQARQIWSSMQTTLQEHGLKTDVDIDDSRFPLTPDYQSIYTTDK
jgi:hypothetical protein